VPHRHPQADLDDLRDRLARTRWPDGVPVKVISERLGHATVAITLDIYSHVIPGMDELAAHTVADLILGDDGDNRTMHRPIDSPEPVPKGGASGPPSASRAWDVSQGPRPPGVRRSPCLLHPVLGCVRWSPGWPMVAWSGAATA
jgi:hypothetical protein